MSTVLFSMFLTNMFLLAIVVVLDITLNKQRYRIVENRILIDKVINLVLQESVLKELCNKNIGKSREAVKCLGKKYLLESSNVVYFMDYIMDAEILRYVGISEEEIKDIYKDVKPFTKIDRCRNDLVMMQLYGAVAHGLLSLLWILFLVCVKVWYN